MGLKSICLAAALALAVAPAWAQPKPPSPDDFANAAAQSDQYEIQAGRVALIQAVNPRVKAFAQQMIDAHQQTSAALLGAVRASELKPPPPIMGADQARMLSALQSMKGADFDKAYATQQVNAHVAALVTEQSYANDGSDANLRRAAQAAIPMIQHHLEMAREIEASLSGK
jgi:putative membrane protein